MGMGQTQKSIEKSSVTQAKAGVGEEQAIPLQGPAWVGDTLTQSLPPWQADSRAYSVPPSGMISHPGRTKMPLSLGQGASAAGTFWVLFIQISVCGEGRAEQNRMLPTGADLRPGLLGGPGAGSKPLLILRVPSTNTSCELRLGQALEVIFTLHPPTRECSTTKDTIHRCKQAGRALGHTTSECVTLDRLRHLSPTVR